jgi:iron-sulfur cluster assembly protein
MINITPAAADQIQKAAAQADATGMCLRIAVRLDEQNTIEYGMGFDERADDDVHFVSQGIEVLVAPGSRDLLTGATLDYVELNPGEHRFIFINPNDPSHVVPKGDHAH